MKKLSLIGLLGLLSFVAMPIYAQDVYFDENYIIIPEDVSTENLDEENVVIEEEVNNELEGDGAILVMEEEPIVEGNIDSDFIPDYDFSDFDGISSVSLGSSNNVGPLVGILAGGLGLLGLLFAYCMFVYFALLPISSWEIYRKAGKKGRAFLVPFWGTMVYSEIAGMNKWLGLLPWLVTIWGLSQGIIGSGTYGIVLNVLSIISLLWLIVANYCVARRYGWNIFASILHAVIIFCPITLLVLGLGNYKYQAKSETVVEA